MARKSKSKKASKENDFPLKFIGEVSWVGAPDGEIGGEVKQALLRSERDLVLQCKSSSYEYDVRLSSGDGLHFEGTFQDTSRTYTVVASATLYTNQVGAVLVGRWREDGWEYRWWAELRRVKRFDHEQDVED